MKTPEPPPLPDELDRPAAADAPALPARRRPRGHRHRQGPTLGPRRGTPGAARPKRSPAATAPPALPAGEQQGCPPGKTFDTWSEPKSSIPAPTQSALRTLEWVGRAENLAICGPSGTGKSHFCEAIAHAVIDAGMRVSWFSLETLTATWPGPRSTPPSTGSSPDLPGRAHRDRRHRDAARRRRRGRSASTGSSTPPTSGAPWPSPPTSTPPASTPSCPSPSPPPPSTGYCTTPISSPPKDPQSASKKPSPAPESSPSAPGHDRRRPAGLPRPR